MRLRRFLLVWTILIAGSSSLALAQKGTASLHGIVIVPSGAPVPGATVTIEGKAGAQAATADSNGEYNVSGLDEGAYQVKIVASEFDPFEVQVTVTGNLMREVDAALMATPKPMELPQEPAVPGATSGEAQGQAPEAATQTSQTSSQTTVAAPQSFSVTAQKGKAAVYGNVTDQSGAVLPSGTATATGSAGPVTVAISGRGQYVLNGLPPGQYKLSVSATGFAPFETDLTLTADQAVEIDATLQPPRAKTEVNVEASNAAQVETQSAHLEGTITEKEVLSTGLNGRNFTQLIALAPGVSNQTGQDEAKVGVAGSVKYSVNGGRVEYNNFDVDGSDVLNAGLNGAESTLMVYPSLDAIQEVKS